MFTNREEAITAGGSWGMAHKLKVAWAKANDDEARRIAIQGAALARTAFTHEAQLLCLQRIVETYGKLKHYQAPPLVMPQCEVAARCEKADSSVTQPTLLFKRTAHSAGVWRTSWKPIATWSITLILYL